MDNTKETLQQSDQINYQQLAQQRKQAQIDKVWNQVEKNPELDVMIKLKNKLETNKKMRLGTTKMLHDTKDKYSEFKSRIKQFIQQQNKTANQLALSSKKKPMTKTQ